MAELDYSGSTLLQPSPLLDYSGSTKVTSQDPNKKLRSSDLLTDSEWINASKQLYKNSTGKDFIGTDEEAAKWNINNMADFEYDITKTIGVAADSKNFDIDTANAWDTTLNKYDQLENWTASGIGRALRFTLTDPTTLPSVLLGFGVGGVAKQLGTQGVKAAAKFAVKEAIKQARQKAIKEAASNNITGKARKELVEGAVKKAVFQAKRNTALFIGAETGAYGGVDNYYRQLLDLQLDETADLNRRAGQKDIDLLELGLSTAGMAAFGVTAGTVLPAVARKIFRGKSVKADDLPDKIYSDQDTLDIAKQQSKLDAPISSTTKAATRIATEALEKNPDATVLSYGAGKVDEVTGTIKEVDELKQSGAKVDAYDLEPNMVNAERTAFRPEYNPYALDSKYDVVNASNVLDNLGSKQNAYNKTRRIVTQISKSVKNDGSVVINPSKKSSMNKNKLQNILEEKFEKVEWNPEEGFFKASTPIEKIVVEVGEDGIPIKKQNKTLLFLKKNFTSDAGAGETIAQGRRLQKNIVGNADKKITLNLKNLERAAKKEYGGIENVPPRLMAQLNAGVEGRLWEIDNLLPKTKKAVLDMRQSIDDVQQQMIDSGAVIKGSDLQFKINRSQMSDFGGGVQGPPVEGESLKFYMNTSYDVFDNPNYKVDPKALAAGKQFFIDKLSTSTAKENEAYRAAKLKQTELDILKKNKKEINLKDNLTDAEQNVINKYENQDGIIDGLLRQLTEKQGDDYTSQLGNILNTGSYKNTIGRNAIKVLQKKENIDPVIAGLLGETKDVRQRYANTLSKLSKIAANYEFNKAIRETADEFSQFGPKTPEQMLKADGLPVVRRGETAEYNIKVNSLASDPEIEGLDQPLQDLWTTKEFKDILEQGTEIYDPLTSGVLTQVYNSFLIGKGITQIAKTAYSVASTLRNLYGAGMSALGNGYINPVHLVEATRAFRQLALLPPEAAQAKIEKMTLLGVLDSDVKVGAMLGLAKDMDSNFFLKGISQYVPKKGRALNRKILDTYQAADNYWKWFAYLNEQGRYKNVLRDKGIDPNKVVRTFRRQGKLVEVTALDEFAAKMVRENMHNYGETSRLVKYARKSPFTDFISFRTEMIRTSKNILKNGIKDLKEGTAQMSRGERNPDGSLKGIAQFKAGVLRMGGASAAVTATGGLSLATVQAFGLDEIVKGTPFTKQEAIEYFDADYNKGSDYIYLSSDDNGKGRRFNLSYIDPWAMFKNPIQAVIRAFQTGDDPDIALEKATNIVMKNFRDSIAPSILTQALFDIARNEDEYGREIAKDQGVVKNTASRLIRLWKAFEPGTVTTAKRIYDSRTKGGFKSSGIKLDRADELKGIGGIRPEEYNIPQAFNFKNIEPSQAIKNSDKYYKKAFTDYRGTEPEVFVDLYKEAQEKKYRGAQEIWKNIQAARAAGMDNRAIIKEITKGGYFKKNLSKQFIYALVEDGIFIPDKPENATLNKWQSFIKKENKGAIQGLPEARKSLWNTYKQYQRLPLTTYKEETLDYSGSTLN